MFYDPRVMSRVSQLLSIRHNLDATTTPTVTDDESSYYSTGSVWIVQATGAVYVCADATTGAADWRMAAPGTLTRYPTIHGPYTFDHGDVSPVDLFDIPARSAVNAFVESTEDDAGGVSWEIGIATDTDAFLADADMPSVSGGAGMGPKGVAGLFFDTADTAILTINVVGTAGAGRAWFEVIPLETS